MKLYGLVKYRLVNLFVLMVVMNPCVAENPKANQGYEVSESDVLPLSPKAALINLKRALDNGDFLAESSYTEEHLTKIFGIHNFSRSELKPYGGIFIQLDSNGYMYNKERKPMWGVAPLSAIYIEYSPANQDAKTNVLISIIANWYASRPEATPDKYVFADLVKSVFGANYQKCDYIEEYLHDTSIPFEAECNPPRSQKKTLQDVYMIYKISNPYGLAEIRFLSEKNLSIRAITILIKGK